MLRLKELKNLISSAEEIISLSRGKCLISTINAHSYNVAQEDIDFAEALSNSDVLIPDGQSIVWAACFLDKEDAPKVRFTGWDLFTTEMNKLNQLGNTTCMFVGSSEMVLDKIKYRAKRDYPNINIETLSPPFKLEFSREDNEMLIDTINKVKPDLLWIGMTAPKQEKWIYAHWNKLDINCHTGAIGAVFDFYAGTVARAPKKWQRFGLEWLYRLMKEPRRMWRRYVLGNPLFIYNVLKEKIKG